MATVPAISRKGKGGPIWGRILLALFNATLALVALWMGMSIPSYFRSVSPLVLEAAAEGTPDLTSLAKTELQGGRPGLAESLLLVAADAPSSGELGALRQNRDDLIKNFPLYKWSGGPAPYYEQFLSSAKFLREDETALIPSLLPQEHRRQLLAFLKESSNSNVLKFLETRSLSGWQLFYPVFSTSGQPLDATILSVALLEQSSAFPDSVRQTLLTAADVSLTGQQAVPELESLYIAVLTLGRHANWLQMQRIIGSCSHSDQLLFAAQAVQEKPQRVHLLIAAILSGSSMSELSEYLNMHGDRGWTSLATAVLMGKGAVRSLIEFAKPTYHPPAFWNRLPERILSGQHMMKGFAETYPMIAIACRVLAFGMSGVFLVGIMRVLVLGIHAPIGHERRLLINLDSLVGSVMATLLVWVLIEPGLLDFRPNEQGTLQIKLAQVIPEESLETIESTTSAMIDQVTILVLLLFFIAQLLVFIFGLLKIAEVRRRKADPEIKLKLLENEEVLFELGLYVGLGGTVGSLILVVLNVVDASLMAAYASTLFGIIFVAILKVAFLRPYRRQLILQK